MKEREIKSFGESNNNCMIGTSSHFKLILSASSQRAEKAYLVLDENLSVLGLNASSFTFIQNPDL